MLCQNVMSTKDTRLPKKPKKLLELKKIPSEDGQTQVCSHQSEHQGVKDCTTSSNILKPERTPSKADKPMKIIRTKRKKSATVESLPIIKKTTSKGKLPTCLKSTPTTESSQTLAQVSILKERGSEPCWSSYAKDLSKKLWLPTETGSVDLRSNWSNGSFKPTESNSWFSIKTWNPQEIQSSQKTCCQSLTFSTAESMVGGNTKKQVKKQVVKKIVKKQPPNACRRVQLFPDIETRKELVNWFGCVRSTYNWALGCIKKNYKGYKINAYWLRNRFINKCNIPKNKQWLLKTPKEVRYSAIVDLVQGYKLNFDKRKKDKNFKFEMKFRSKKDHQSLTIPHSTIKWDYNNGTMKMFPKFLKTDLGFHCRDVPEGVNHDCKLVLDKLGRFYLCIPIFKGCENQTVEEKNVVKEEWCSLDPGIRTFMTLYSPTKNVCHQIGKNDIGRIYRLCIHLDKLVGTKKKVEKARERLRQRIHHLVDEVHWKTIHFLKSNFKNVIIPPFEVSNMVKKSNRKIGKKSVRQMLTWRHFTFRQRLLLSSKDTDTKIHVLGEEYTSKTCSNCMNINYTLGGAKTYKCKKCKVILDRDVNGARNIFLKNVILETKSASGDSLLALPR